MNDKHCTPMAFEAPSKPADERESFEQLALWSKAMGHPVRLRIVSFLLAQEGCMCGDIVEHIDLAQSTVSQHLKMLKDCGIIQGTIDGSKTCYCVNPLVLDALALGVSELLAKRSSESNPSCTDC